MNINKLTDLFSSLSTRREAPNTPRPKPVGKEDSISQSPEAVKISSDFGRGQEVDGARRERVEEIKKQVKAGVYKPEAQAVAEAIANDLFS